MRALAGLGIALIALVGCGSDHQVTQLCSRDEAGFDIEEASALEDAQSYPNMHDAVILEYDLSEMPAGATWRVKAVEIMPMVPTNGFDSFSDGQEVTVEIWDADDPESSDPYVVTRVFEKDDLTWEDVRLTDPTEAVALEQQQAWWTFDFSDVIPTSGLMGPEYLVSVSWTSDALPALGYSNFNNSCARNWTDADDGFGWELNSTGLADADMNTCSWPMLRVSLEVIEEQEFCEEESSAVE